MAQKSGSMPGWLVGFAALGLALALFLWGTGKSDRQAAEEAQRKAAGPTSDEIQPLVPEGVIADASWRKSTSPSAEAVRDAEAEDGGSLLDALDDGVADERFPNDPDKARRFRTSLLEATKDLDGNAIAVGKPTKPKKEGR